MKAFSYIKSHAPQATTLLLVVGVFAYWLLVNPQLLYYRETMQLFLWRSDYLMMRLAVPGGLAQYLGELLTACCLQPVYGATIYALLFLMAQQLSAQIIGSQRHFAFSLIAPILLFVISMQPSLPMTLTVAILLTMLLAVLAQYCRGARAWFSLVLTPIGYWLVGPVIILLPLYLLRFLASPAHKRRTIIGCIGGLLLWTGCIAASSRMVAYPLRQLALGIDYHWTSEMMGTDEEMTYDMLSRRQAWAAIVSRFEKHPSDVPAIRAVAEYASFRLGLIDEKTLQQGIAPSFGSQSSLPAMLMTSEVYLQIGLINMSQRNAFEAMEGIPNCNKSARVLHRLVETNLITGQYAVALKYISILEQTPFYRSWARRMRQLAEHPQLIKEHPFYDTLQQAYQATNDSFF